MSLQKRLRDAQKRDFIGRTEQLELFKQNISADIPLYPIVQVAGQGGVGKTTLLKRFQDLCHEYGVPYALTDHQQKTPISVMQRISELLEKVDSVFDLFNERYKAYIRLHEKIAQEPDKSDTLASLLSKAVGKGILVASRATPFTGPVVDLIGADFLEENMIALTSYLFQKLKNKDDVNLLMDPIAELSPLFLSGLNKIARQKQIVLMFDTFEETQESLIGWVMKLFGGDYGEVSEKISFVFAGRSFDKHDWLLVEQLLVRFDLESFTEQEVKDYLKHWGISEEKEIEEIYILSKGLPVSVAMLAAPGKASSGHITRTVVERFLRDIDNSIKRQTALRIALSRRFDKDLVAMLVATGMNADEVNQLFDWFVELPFVEDQSGYWVYHAIVRSQMIIYQRNQSPKEFTETHSQLSQYYWERARTHENKSSNKWHNLTWWPDYIEATYHSVCADPNKLIDLKKEVADILFGVGDAEILAWIEAIKQSAADLGGYESIIDLAVLVESGLKALAIGNWRGAFKLLDIFDLLWKTPRNLNFEEGSGVDQRPIGWFVGGSHPQNYQISIDSDISYEGKASGSIKSRAATSTQSARLMQVIKAENYRGKRIRVSAYIKSFDVTVWAGLWVEVIGVDDQALAYDNMDDRPIKGTNDWIKYTIVLDVPKESARIVLGLFIEGPGQLWIDDAQLEVIDKKVRITGQRNKKSPVNLNFNIGTKTKQIPVGWYIAGSHPNEYQVGLDHYVTCGSNPSAYIKSIVTQTHGFGTLTQSFKADKYRGKKLRMSAYVKSDNVEDWAGLQMRVEGPQYNRPLNFDNMYDRPIKGTCDWQKHEVILYVPRESVKIAFGVLLDGMGRIWVSNFQFEVVEQDVLETGLDNSQVPRNLDFKQSTSSHKDLPEYWFEAGSHAKEYEIGIDTQEKYRGNPSAYLKSHVEKTQGFGTLMQMFKADNHIGRYLRMSAYVKSDNVEEWAGLWMRVDGPERGQSLSFDNMQNRPIKGTVDWKKYEIVLDVPQESIRIAFGILLRGKGQVWVNDFHFEVVDQTISETKSEQLIKQFTEALNLNPENVEALSGRASQYSEMKQYKQAIEDYTKVIGLDPHNIHSLTHRGYCYLYLANYNLAIADFSGVILCNPEDANAYYNLACAYALQKDLNTALSTLRRALELDSLRLIERIANDPDFDPIRSEPRFQALLLEFAEQD